MSERDELVAKLLKGEHGWLAYDLNREAADQIKRDKQKIERLAAEGDRLEKACFRQGQQISGQAMTVKKLTEDRDFWRDQFQVETRARIGLREALADLLTAYAACNGEDHPAYRRARAALNGEGET